MPFVLFVSSQTLLPRLLVLPVLLACGGAGPAPLAPRPAAEERVALPKPFPPVPLVQLDGSQADLRTDAAGRVTLVDLWATWCKACEAGHARLERLASAYAGTELFIVGVTVGEDADTVRSYLESHPYSYPVYLDSQVALADTLQEPELPALLVLNPQGQIVHRTGQLNVETLELLRTQLASQSVRR